MGRLSDAITARFYKLRIFAIISYFQWFWEVHGPRRHAYLWTALTFACGIVLMKCLSYPYTTGIVVESHSALLHGPQVNGSLTFAQVEEEFFREVERVHLRCDLTERIGSYFDGGWEVCLASFFKPSPDECLAYSFGVEYNFGYDEQIAQRFECVVRAFDPSMGIKSHVHRPGPVHFYNYGLAGVNTVWEGKFERHPNNFNQITLAKWEVRTLDRLMETLHDKGKTIDILKVDIEYSEWAAFEQMIASGALRLAKILMFEVHTKEVQRKQTTKADYLRYLGVLRGIERLGFRKYKSHLNKMGIGPMRRMRTGSGFGEVVRSYMSSRSCCYELYYVNMNFVY